MNFTDISNLTKDYLKLTTQINKLLKQSIEKCKQSAFLIKKQLVDNYYNQYQNGLTEYVLNALPYQQSSQIRSLEKRRNDILNQLAKEEYNGFSAFKLNNQLLMQHLQNYFLTKGLTVSYVYKQEPLTLYKGKFTYFIYLKVGKREYLLQTSKFTPFALNSEIDLPISPNKNNEWPAILKRFPDVIDSVLNALEEIYTKSRQRQSSKTAKQAPKQA